MFIDPNISGISVTVSALDDPIRECSAVKLARYAQIVGYNECPFWGINYEVGEQQCRYIWTLPNRFMIAKYLCEAQDEIEAELGYLVGPQWTTENKKRYKHTMFTNLGYVRAFGVEAFSNISLGAAVNQAADPAVIGPIATTVTDTSEIVVYHPGTDLEIIPSKVTIAGGNVTIEIPRCRTVKATYVDNPPEGWLYTDVATWGLTTVDVKRRYNDQLTQGVLSTNHDCSSVCYLSGCTAFTQTACAYIKQPTIGLIEVIPATSGATWNPKCTCKTYNEVQLNYLSGVDLNPQLEDMIVRLAHAKMPSEPCGCDPLRSLWVRDRNVPEALSNIQATNPFGMSDGAFTAWKFAHAMKLIRGGIVG